MLIKFSIRFFKMRSITIVLLAGIAVLVPSALAPLGQLYATNTSDDGSTLLKVGTSAVGNYLAGRHAQGRHDMGAAVMFFTAALEDLFFAPDLRRRTFLLLVAEGRINDALPLARTLKLEEPKASIVNLVLSAADLADGENKKAERILRDVKETGLSAYTTPLLRAWSLAGEQDKSGALKALRPLLKNDSTKGLYSVQNAMLLDFFDDPRASAAYDELSRKKLSGTSRLTRHMGQYYERQGEVDKARAIYKLVSRDLPGSPLLDAPKARLEIGQKPPKLLRTAKDGAAEALFSLASSLRRQRGHETALILARLALHLRPDFPIALVLVADMLSDERRYAESNVVYNKIDVRSPYRASADLSRARNFDYLKNTEAAADLYREVAKERTHDPQPLMQLGNLLRRHERWNEAIDAYTTAIYRVGTLKKHHWRMLYARGITLERAKRWPEAEKDFLRALEFEPEQPFVLNYLGYSWIDQGLNLARAQDMIRRAVELRPNDGYIIDSLGWGYYRLGKFEEAVREIERAVQIRPEDPIINDHLGDVYWCVGRELEARYQWQRALSLGAETDRENTIKSKLAVGIKPSEILTVKKIGLGKKSKSCGSPI
ncbi:MAG: hypothetical protein CBB68_00625 [Rhodospirillaceae bacterium TMED8]|nr:hypothetical protein [Magnetovibrio sp.]OUT53192.1 MAG: hypothetical protein CBB68_00625 [Rhodospirillaceae bacterium TMED8]